MKKYKEVFDYLKDKEIYQFKSYISASQYIQSYRLVEKYCKLNSKILDWGSGNSHFSYFLLKKVFNVIGFTIEEESPLSNLLKEEYKNYQSIVIPEVVDLLPFNENVFDAVVSIGVLEHVRETGGNEIKSLREIKRVLNHSGIFICTHLPNKYSWIEFLTAHIKSKHHHIFKYNKSEILSMVKESGFELLEIGRYGIFPRLMFGSSQTSPLFTNIFNKIEKTISLILPVFCQNYYFVLRKN